MIDLAALTNEINTDPLNLGYSELIGQDSALADLLNEKNFTMFAASVSSPKLLKWSASMGLLGAFADAKESENPIARSIAIAIDKLLTYDGALEVDDEMWGMMDALIAFGVMTTEQKDSFSQLATIPASRMEILFGADARANHSIVAAALGRGSMST